MTVQIVGADKKEGDDEKALGLLKTGMDIYGKVKGGPSSSPVGSNPRDRYMNTMADNQNTP